MAGHSSAPHSGSRGRAQTSSESHQQARAELVGRLRDRFPELEHAVLTRIRAVAPFDDDDDPEYVHGLRRAVRAAIEYSLDTIETSASQAPPIPEALLGQARVAARHGVELGVVLRRYDAGRNQLSDLILGEAEQDRRLQRAALRRMLREQTAVLERVLAELEVEYAREPQTRINSADALLAERIRRLLAGEFVNTTDLNYDFEGYHLGAVTEGEDAAKALRALARGLDGRLLLVRPGGNLVWAWIGTRRGGDRDGFDKSIASHWPSGVPLALGERGHGPTNWCLTHEQAREAYTFALRDPDRPLRYMDVALVAAIEKDPVASASLRQTFLAPLSRGRDRGGTLRSTLCAYFALGRNGASTSSALDVSRQAISSRLQRIEKHLGRPIAECAAELEVALRLDEYPFSWRSPGLERPGRSRTYPGNAAGRAL